MSQQLRNRADELWREHLGERAEDERPEKFTMGSPKVEWVDGAPRYSDGPLSDVYR